VSIFNNLVIIRGRDVSFGQQDPELAHQIFVEEALIKNQVTSELTFLEHNQRLIGQIRLFEEKLRHRNILIPEPYLFDFYSNRLQGVYNLAGLEKRIRNAGGDDFLRLEEENLCFTRPPQEMLEKFPDSIKILGHIYQLRYRFAPGEEDDGVTILVPRGLINNIPEDFITWPVPGLIRERVEACLKALPKEYRKLLQPLSEKVELIVEELKPGPYSFFTALTTVLKEKLKVDIPGDIWGKLDIPRYLKMRIAVLNESGEVILSSRDLGFLKKMLSSRSGQLAQEDSPGWKEARARWERQGLTGWADDLLGIPEEITIDDFLKGYPALTVGGEKFEVKLYQTQADASKAHLEAVEAILTRHFQKDLNFILRSYSFPGAIRPTALFFGGEFSLKNSIIKRIKEEVFQKNFRSLDELQSFIKESALKQLFEKSHQIFTAVLELLQEYQKTRDLIQEMRKTREKLGVSSSLPDRLKDELEQLVPQDFLAVYSFEFLIRLPRIVQALGLRAERARLSAEKDLAKAAQVEPFLEGYERLKKQASKNPAPKTEKLLFELRWMIEEFKISLFAPEIKTAFPVSAKRLAARIKEIEAAIEG
jgi:ATP-dependent helicase HrpA